MPVLTLEVTGNGGVLQCTYVGSSTHWDAVNTSSTDTYLKGASYRNWTYDSFVLSAAAIPNAAIINSVTIKGTFYTPVGYDGSGRLIAYFGQLFTYGVDIGGGGIRRTVEKYLGVAPDGTPWQRSDLDTIHFGCGLYPYTLGGPYCEYLWVLVDFTPIAAGGAQIVGLEL